ncbi:MAG: hypothetical protein WD063_21240 [Pirellulales bacterium]
MVVNYILSRPAAAPSVAREAAPSSRGALAAAAVDLAFSLPDVSSPHSAIDSPPRYELVPAADADDGEASQGQSPTLLTTAEALASFASDDEENDDRACLVTDLELAFLDD